MDLEVQIKQNNMSKFYLLTFSDDWADEHDVPALECMTEDEYLKWLNRPAGVLNKDYEKYDALYKEKVDIAEKALNRLKELNLYHTPVKDIPKNLRKEYDQLSKVCYVSFRDKPTKLKESYLYARLGNGGEGFDEGYRDFIIMKDFVDRGNVKVYEVNENFYETFQKCGLSRLSLCNIFEEFDDYDEDK